MKAGISFLNIKSKSWCFSALKQLKIGAMEPSYFRLMHLVSYLGQASNVRFMQS